MVHNNKKQIITICKFYNCSYLFYNVIFDLSYQMYKHGGKLDNGGREKGYHVMAVTVNSIHFIFRDLY